mmetsp:Transcript_39940/g.96362  ORF Transcript_39940/g.96362 Transcript_39940/m.96362 type:complete len:210 (+) Transcript_39940:375-1004(+)
MIWLCSPKRPESLAFSLQMSNIFFYCFDIIVIFSKRVLKNYHCFLICHHCFIALSLPFQQVGHVVICFACRCMYLTDGLFANAQRKLIIFHGLVEFSFLFQHARNIVVRGCKRCMLFSESLLFYFQREAEKIQGPITPSLLHKDSGHVVVCDSNFRMAVSKRCLINFQRTFIQLHCLLQLLFNLKDHCHTNEYICNIYMFFSKSLLRNG